MDAAASLKFLALPLHAVRVCGASSARGSALRAGIGQNPFKTIAGMQRHALLQSAVATWRTDRPPVTNTVVVGCSGPGFGLRRRLGGGRGGDRARRGSGYRGTHAWRTGRIPAPHRAMAGAEGNLIGSIHG